MKLLREHVKLLRAHVKGITCAREVITCARKKFSIFFHHVPLGVRRKKCLCLYFCFGLTQRPINYDFFNNYQMQKLKYGCEVHACLLRIFCTHMLIVYN